MTYAIVTDVGTRLGRPITDANETAQVQAWLGDVESMILERLPDLATRIADGDLLESTVVRVEANAVVRKVRNPDGKVSEDIDDYRYRYGENAARGELFLTDEEWLSLAPSTPAGAFSVRPSFEPDMPTAGLDWS